MGNNPSKNDPLPNISAMSGQSSSSGVAQADLESDEGSTGLPRPTGNGSDVLIEKMSNFNFNNHTILLSFVKSSPQSIPAATRKLKRQAAQNRDFHVQQQLNVEIDTSVAAILSSLAHLPTSPGKWKLAESSVQSTDYASSVESQRSGNLSVSPVFTTNEAKDESLVLSVSLLGNSPICSKSAHNPFQTPLESSLDPIVEASAESTPEPRHRKTLAVAKTAELERNVLSKLSSKLSSGSPPLLPTSKKVDVDIDSVIDRLLAIGMKKHSAHSSPSKSRRGKDKLPLTTQELKHILARSRSIFLDQPTLLKLSPPVKIVGDIHGQFHDLIRIFNSCGYPPQTNYLFLGDYVDRGYKSLETILLLLCYKIKYPENFFMLRGNHESANITKIYGFYDECKRRLPLISGSHKLWKNFIDVFNSLPIAATINDKIFCIHGGLSPELMNLKQIEQIQRPTDIPDKGLLADLLWSDPDPLVRTFSHTNWPKNDRGVSYCFGRKHVDHFLLTFNMDLIVRGHMVVEDGYEFFNKRKLVTVFSAPNYCGEFNNYGAIMSVDKSLCCSFELLKPQ